MEKYKQLLIEVEVLLKKQGFTKKGSSFYILKDNNWGLIDFQKSRDNSIDSLKFTINIGISSTTLRSFFEENLKDKPSIIDCNWQKRVGFLLPINKDMWWQITNDTNLASLQNEINLIILSLVIPYINSKISDINLETNWQNGISEGLTDYQRCRNLLILMKYNKRNNIDSVIENLKNNTSKLLQIDSILKELDLMRNG